VPPTTVYGHLDPVTKGKRPAVPAGRPGWRFSRADGDGDGDGDGTNTSDRAPEILVSYPLKLPRDFTLEDPPRPRTFE
jgi:hypothetical protein